MPPRPRCCNGVVAALSPAPLFAGRRMPPRVVPAGLRPPFALIALRGAKSLPALHPLPGRVVVAAQRQRGRPLPGPITRRCAAAPPPTSTRRGRSSFASPPKRPARDDDNSGGGGAGSLLSSILGAGAGTFASTLLALYLAVVVENSAHATLHEYFPHWYSEVADDDLPHCIRDREIARRITGMAVMNRARGVDAATSAGSGLMGMDGWMETTGDYVGGGGLLEAELLSAEEEFEQRQRQPEEEERGIGGISAMSGWQRKMTEKRARIIENEERDFSSGIVSSSSSSPSHREERPGAEEGERFPETRRMQEEATRKLRERLLSVAMTA